MLVIIITIIIIITSSRYLCIAGTGFLFLNKEFMTRLKSSEAEFKEFEPWLKFKPRLVLLKIVLSFSRIKPALN